MNALYSSLLLIQLPGDEENFLIKDNLRISSLGNDLPINSILQGCAGSSSR